MVRWDRRAAMVSLKREAEGDQKDGANDGAEAEAKVEWHGHRPRKAGAHQEQTPQWARPERGGWVLLTP